MLSACNIGGMSFIQIKNVSPDIHDAVRRRAKEEAMSVSDYVLDLIQCDLALPSRRVWLTRLATREPADVSVVSALDDARAEREKESSGI